jgi:membrane protein YqaA with SNARE-associated domain
MGIKNPKRLLGAIPILFFISFSIFFLAYSSPEKLINFIGADNAYGLIFVLAFIGGLTTFSGVPYHLILITLASGGLNPFWLGLSASTGVMLGDSTSYFIGYQGRAITPVGWQKFFGKVYDFGFKHPALLPLLFFLYGALVPLSNDFIVISMGLARYPFWRVMIPLGLGNLVFNFGLSYFSIYAYNFVKIYF